MHESFISLMRRPFAAKNLCISQFLNKFQASFTNISKFIYRVNVCIIYSFGVVQTMKKTKYPKNGYTKDPEVLHRYIKDIRILTPKEYENLKIAIRKIITRLFLTFCLLPERNTLS